MVAHVSNFKNGKTCYSSSIELFLDADDELETSADVAMKPGRAREAMQQVAAALCPLNRLGSVISAARWGIRALLIMKI